MAGVQRTGIFSMLSTLMNDIPRPPDPESTRQADVQKTMARSEYSFPAVIVIKGFNDLEEAKKMLRKSPQDVLMNIVNGSMPVVEITLLW